MDMKDKNPQNPHTNIKHDRRRHTAHMCPYKSQRATLYTWDTGYSTISEETSVNDAYVSMSGNSFVLFSS